MPSDLETLLEQYRQGHQGAMDELFVRLQPRLRVLAHVYLRHERPDATLRSTALVNELFVWLRTKLAEKAIRYSDASHLLGLLAVQMQHILRDIVRKKAAKKRGGALIRVSADEGDVVDDHFVRFEKLDRALDALHAEDTRAYRVFFLRHRIGFTAREISELLGISEAAVYREDEYARSFLKLQLGNEEPIFPKRFVERFREEE